MKSTLRQRGVAAVVFLAVFVLILVGVLTTAFGSKSVQNDFDAKTYPVLAAAKEALIAYAVANPKAPGAFPCADNLNTGTAPAAPCGSSGTPQVGRLPWRTLGLPIPRDGSGECLWYAVSGKFVNLADPINPINSDTTGELTVVDDSNTPIATAVIAVIFAPGQALETNNRTPPPPPVTQLCPGSASASDYLDGKQVGVLPGPTVLVNNATAGATTLVGGKVSDTFNDRLIYITAAELFPRVERRVASEIKQILRTYYNANQYYPFAAPFSDTVNYACATGTTRGRLPLTMSSPDSDCNALANLTPALPAWYQSHGWHELTYYTVAPSCASPGVNCIPAGPLLGVLTGSGSRSAQAIVIEAGRTLPTLGHTRVPDQLSDYLDGTENTNGDDTYASLPKTATFDDVVVIVAP
jgi:hypothetical protein